jgi:Na+/H+ antiporter NhaD/arsenite permease-like protein
MLGVKLVTIIVFALALALTALFDGRKVMIAWGAVAVLVLCGALPAWQVASYLDWDVMLLYAGMMLIGEALLYSRMPDHIATHLAARTGSARLAMLAICGFAGFVSMFVMNIAAVLVVAPVALAVAKKCGIEPVPLFIGIALSVNLFGAATMIGDPPSMLVGASENLSFNDFFLFEGKPGMFFAVLVAAAAAFPVLWLFFRGYDHCMPKIKPEPYLSFFPSAAVVLLVLVLAALSSVEHRLPLVNGGVCLAFGMACLAWYSARCGLGAAAGFLRRLDWHTGAFLAGIFVLVGSLSYCGIVEDLASLIIWASGTDAFGTYALIVGVSTAASALVLNIPYVAFMLPVTEMVAWQVAVDSHALVFGLLLAGSLGGNITPIGASANIVAVGILKEHGHSVSWRQFVKVGIAFTAAATLAGCGAIWLWFS